MAPAGPHPTIRMEERVNNDWKTDVTDPFTFLIPNIYYNNWKFIKKVTFRGFHEKSSGDVVSAVCVHCTEG